MSIGWLIYLLLVLLDDMDWYGLVLFCSCVVVVLEEHRLYIITTWHS
jgi:hypothetical protein